MNALYNEAIAEFETVPESMFSELIEFIKFLKFKANNNSAETQEAKPIRKPGALKGKIFMSDDFDEPLEDFKEYM